MAEGEVFAVIFTSRLRDDDPAYGELAARMEALAKEQPGFLRMTSVRDETGLGITVSYWDSEEAISAWRRQADHLAAQTLGRERWYADYSVEIGKIRRRYKM